MTWENILKIHFLLLLFRSLSEPYCNKTDIIALPDVNIIIGARSTIESLAPIVCFRWGSPYLVAF